VCEKKYVVKDVKDFNLDHIFDCGQCFRWEKQDDGSYVGVAMGKICRMTFDDGTLTIDNCDQNEFENIWKPYLDLNKDYGTIKDLLSDKDEVIEKAAKYGYGIRILKQDFWETVVSFIISQNNNIPRIKGCIDNLSRLFGEKIGGYNGKECYSLPTPEKLASLTVEDLEPVKLGYRASYLIKMAKQMIEQGGPEAVEKRLSECENPIEELQKFCGVGPKVAACISLFGLGRVDAFPIDVWIRRVMNQLYGIDEKAVKEMNTYAKETFGEYGGIAQQYLFYYIRGLQ
jgi:N-glycosylase/DNA lyase